MDDKKLSLWEKYLTKEIAIEFKACLYFFALLFFYCVYRVACGIYEAGILHLTEMIFSCYFIGYAQVYLFGNFDESDELKGRELAGMFICTGTYVLLSFICGWFDRIWWVSAIYAVYWIVTYLCVFFIYRSKRRIDDKKLNEELRLFQAGHHKKVQDKDE